MNVFNDSNKFKRVSVDSDRSRNISSEINNSFLVSEESNNFECGRIKNNSEISENFQEVIPGEYYASVFGEAGLLSDEQEIANLEYQDHTYGLKMNYHSAENQIGSLTPTMFHTYYSPSQSLQEISSNQITDINVLRKITPRVKLLNQESPTLQPVRKVNSSLKMHDQNLDSTRKALKKYCRTCAEVKFPLIDIFSDKGIQMKLSQQIRHLENIKETDSLSTQMCMDCICDLRMSYNFFMQIKTAENKLKSIQAKLLETANLKKQEEANLKKQEEANLKKQEEASKIDPLFIPHDPENVDDNGPRISAVYSAQDSQSWEPDPLLNVKMEPQILEEDKLQSDNDSLEEFDPEDPPYNPDSEEEENSEEELENAPSLFKSPKRLEAKSFVNKESEKIEIESESLKRKLSEERNEAVDILSKLKTIGPKDAKIRKLNVNEALNIKKEENGVMYVTVRGSKPNELLLVKVKKMDKAEKGKTLGKKDAPKEKEKDPFIDRSFDEKGQIIEEQIEEYKKKREKILGASAQNDVTELYQGEVRIKSDVLNVKEKESLSEIFHEEEAEILEESLDIKEIIIPEDLPKDILPKAIQINPILTNEISKEVPEIKQEVLEIKKEVLEIRKEKTKKSKEPKPKVYNNPEEYNFRIETVKTKWEDKQRKDWEEAHPGVENPVDRLKRILGKASEGGNLQDFLENLQQRKMILTKLNDEDIITLFQERINSQKDVSEAEEEVKVEVPEVELFECDFCFLSFPTQEVIDEHMKIHDAKILHYCEDCNEEFTVLRLKKNHNVICIRKLICKYCDLMLDSKGKKRQHEQKHCDNLFGALCEYCGEKFKHHGTLDQHVKSRHMALEKVFQCPKCPKKFAIKTKLSFHLKSVHTSLRAYLCEDCGADFKNPASLRHHRIRKHQPTGNKKECPVCNKMIPFYSLSKHMHTHKPYNIKCPHCTKTFKNSSTLKQHVRIHEDQRQFRCDTCGVGFNRRDGLRLHMKVHEKSDSRGLKECSCQVCGEKFPNHSMLVIHRNRVHKDGRNHTCTICNRSMISDRSLAWHLAHIHNEALPGVIKEEMDGGGETKRVCCFHCNKTFKTEMILRTHIKNSHMQKEPVKCLDCDLTFTSDVRLRHHMMVTHNRLEGTLECPHCPKRFVNQLRLKTHMISHSEDRPYTCEICGFNLKTKIQLIKHHQNRHSDERPLQCRHCDWRCKQVSALVCHERTHTNERPYACSVCKQRFKYLGDKNKHERRHVSLGGSGFKRIVTTRSARRSQPKEEGEGDSSISEQDQLVEQMEEDMEMEESLDYEIEEENVKLEERGEVTEDDNEYSNYQQDYEETSREASEAAEVIMSMEDGSVYTEEVTAEETEQIETTHIIEDEIMANEILQSGTVVHIEQQDEEGKIQVIPVVLSIPDLATENSEVDLATASIMYNEECN